MLEMYAEAFQSLYTLFAKSAVFEKLSKFEPAPEVLCYQIGDYQWLWNNFRNSEVVIEM